MTDRWYVMKLALSLVISTSCVLLRASDATAQDSDPSEKARIRAELDEANAPPFNPSQAPSAERSIKGFASITDGMPMYLSQVSAASFRMDAGSRFVAVLETGISSSTANLGDPVSAKTATPIYYDGKIVIPAGSTLHGTIFLVDKSRSPLKSDLPGKHWLNAQGALGLRFDKLVIGHKSFPLNATPAAKAVVNAVASTTRSRLVTDKNGDITVYYGAGKYGAMEVAIEGGSLATGPFGLIVGPALSGIAGAASPSYAFGHPEEQKGFKERTKGFFVGMVKGLPGGGIVTGAAEHGYDVALVPGDKVILELKEDATF